MILFKVHQARTLNACHWTKVKTFHFEYTFFFLPENHKNDALGILKTGKAYKTAYFNNFPLLFKIQMHKPTSK